MQIIKATTEEEREQSRILINEVMPTGQYILRNDYELISAENRERELSGRRELFILVDQDKKIKGAVVLELTENEAYILYLTRYSHAQKGSGKKLLEEAEKISKGYQKKEVRLSIVYHPNCPQQKLEQWYYDQKYEHFHTSPPNDEHKKAWKPEFHTGTVFKYFKKNIS